MVVSEEELSTLVKTPGVGDTAIKPRKRNDLLYKFAQTFYLFNSYTFIWCSMLLLRGYSFNHDAVAIGDCKSAIT